MSDLGAPAPNLTGANPLPGPGAAGAGGQGLYPDSPFYFDSVPALNDPAGGDPDPQVSNPDLQTAWEVGQTNQRLMDSLQSIAVPSLESPDTSAAAVPATGVQAASPVIQPSWFPDQINQKLLDSLKDGPPASPGGNGASDPVTAGTPDSNTASDDPMLGQGNVTLRAPDPQTFAPAVRGLLDSVANQPLPSPSIGPSNQKMLAVIRHGEAYADENGNGADYNTVNGFKPGKSGLNLSQMTIAQAVQYQKDNPYWDRKYPGVPQRRAIGAYQFKPDTLHSMAQELQLDPDKTKMDNDTQDMLAGQLIKDQKSQATKNGILNKGKFMKNLATQWASLPGDASGYSIYTKPKDRIPTNKTRVVPAAVSDAIDEMTN